MRACVTGFGIVDGLGYSPEECYANYMSDKDFIQSFETACPIKKGYRVDETLCQYPAGVKVNTLTRNGRFSLHVVQQALEMAKVPQTTNVGVFFSQGPEHDVQTPLYRDEKVSPRKLVNCLPGSIPAMISVLYGFEGAAVGTMAACATGLMTMEWAMHYLDDFDFIVVGASESSTQHIGSSFFGQLGVLSDMSMPFDKHRNGFVLGEGAGCVIIESEEKAKARGAKIYATLHRVGFANDTSSLTSPDMTGRGMKTAMTKALRYAGLDTVNSISAHATSTAIGDLIEYNAIESLGLSVPVYSAKSKNGHSINASGTLETIYAILFGMHGHTGYNYNLTTPLVDDPCLVTQPVTLAAPTSTVLNNSFGFGGRCASQVMEVYKQT